MSKIICDFCGTSYPETTTQCPICGSVRPGNIGAVNNSNGGQQTGNGYQYVKGGRFSKANVKKRNQGKVYAPEESDDDVRGGGSNKGLIIAIIILFLAIVAVGVYILISFLSADETPVSPIQPSVGISTPSTQTQIETVGTEPVVIACTGVKVTKKPEAFKSQGDGILLSVEKTPADTTDALEFFSSDEQVATVSPKGLVTAVGHGEAVITIKCGEAETTVTITCTFGNNEEATQPTEPVVPDEELIFEFRTYTGEPDITLFTKGEKANLYVGTVPVDQITWATDDEKVATFQKGVVEATGSGVTYVRATYNDKVYECKVICRDSVGVYTEPVEEEEPTPEDQEYSASPTSLTLIVGQTDKIYLRRKDGSVVTDAEWISENESVCTVTQSDEGNYWIITGVAEGSTMVSTTYDGMPAWCNVEVVAAS